MKQSFVYLCLTSRICTVFEMYKYYHCKLHMCHVGTESLTGVATVSKGSGLSKLSVNLLCISLGSGRKTQHQEKNPHKG